jgi:hypothetical protein
MVAVAPSGPSSCHSCSGPHPDRQVESFADHVDAAIGAFQQHLDLGVLLHETRDYLADLKGDERRWATNAHDAARLGAHPVDGFLGGLGLDHHRYAMAVIFPADLGDGEAPRRAVDQLYPKAGRTFPP